MSSTWSLLGKYELIELIDQLKAGDPSLVADAVQFVCVESFGMWHNRARAKICRFFKNHPPTEIEQRRLVDAVVERLKSGRFSEQFKDQLAMAVRFDADRMRQIAEALLGSPIEYVVRYARWVLDRERDASAEPE